MERIERTVKRRTLNWIRRLACAGTLLSGLKLQVQLAVGEIADYFMEWTSTLIYLTLELELNNDAQNGLRMRLITVGQVNCELASTEKEDWSEQRVMSAGSICRSQELENREIRGAVAKLSIPRQRLMRRSS